jgi:hypothetical protein
MWNPKHQGKWQEHGKEETNVKKKKKIPLCCLSPPLIYKMSQDRWI